LLSDSLIVVKEPILGVGFTQEGQSVMITFVCTDNAEVKLLRQAKVIDQHVSLKEEGRDAQGRKKGTSVLFLG